MSADKATRFKAGDRVRCREFRDRRGRRQNVSEDFPEEGIVIRVRDATNPRRALHPQVVYLQGKDGHIHGLPGLCFEKV